MIDDWIPYKLDQLGFVGRGRSRHRPRNDPSLYGGDCPFFQTGDVKAAELYLHEYSATYNEAGLAQSKMWEANTLCITIAANIAESAILSIPGCFPDSVVGFVADADIADMKFVKYKLDTLKMAMQSASLGTTQDNLSLDKLLRFDFLVPPLATQQRIGSILSAYDDLIENNTRRITILEEMARRLYEEWFVKRRPEQDDKFPDWEWTTLGAVCEAGGGGIQTGPFGSQLHQRDYQPSGTPVVMPKNLRGGRVLIEDCARISEEDAKRLSKHELHAFDIVFGRRGEIGRKAIIRPHEAGAICGTGCLKVSLGNPEVSPFYLSEFFSEGQTVADLSGRAIGATMPNLNTSILAETKVAMPPKRAVDQYHELASASDEMTTLLHRKNANLRAQRDLLLPKLVSGEIELNEAVNAVEAAE